MTNLKSDYRTVTLKPGDAVALRNGDAPFFVVVKDRGDGTMVVKDHHGAEWVYPRTRLVKTPTAAEVADETPTAAEVADEAPEAVPGPPEAVPGPSEVTLTLDEAAVVMNRLMAPAFTLTDEDKVLLTSAAQKLVLAVVARG